MAPLGVARLCCAKLALACNTSLRIGSRSLLAHYEHQEQADYKQASDIPNHEDQRGEALSSREPVKNCGVEYAGKGSNKENGYEFRNVHRCCKKIKAAAFETFECERNDYKTRNDSDRGAAGKARQPQYHIMAQNNAGHQ